MRMLRMNWGSLGSAGDLILNALSRLPFSWRGLSALILGVLLAKWFWILFAPHSAFTAAMPDRAAGLEAGRLFGVTQSTDVATQGVAIPNVQLLGVFAASAGKPGFAILKLDDKRQVGVAEGEDVAPGTRLVEVEAGYVLLERAGVRQKVILENKYAATPNKNGLPAYAASADKQNIDTPDKIVQDRLRQLRR